MSLISILLILPIVLVFALSNAPDPLSVNAPKNFGRFIKELPLDFNNTLDIPPKAVFELVLYSDVELLFVNSRISGFSVTV